MDVLYKTDRVPGVDVLSCTGDFRFPMHIHDRYVLWLNSGCGEHFRVKGSSGVLGTGSFSIISPGEVHSNHGCRDEGRHLRSFYIDGEFLSGLSQEMTGKDSAFPRFEKMIFRDPGLCRSLTQLHDLMTFGGRGMDLESLVRQQFMELLDRYGAVPVKEYPVDGNTRRVDMVTEYLHEHSGSDVSLEKLAELAGCTTFHLIRLFKKHKGLTTHAYLIQLRLEHARKLLSRGESISQAAAMSGFADQSHLTRQFKIRYGMTPKAFTRQRFSW